METFEMADYPIRLRLPEGVVEAFVEIADGPHRLVDLAFQMLGLSGVVAEMGEKAAARNGVAASCAKGCGACCRQLVPLSPPEAVLMSELVESMDEPRKSAVKNRFVRAVDRLEKTGLSKKLEDPDDPLLCKAEEEYFFSRIPCPFLENESCGIYESRPSRCREYLVFTPPENCADPYRRKIGRLPVSMRMNEALAWLWASMTKQKPRYIPLALSLKWSAENPGTSVIGADPERMVEVLCGFIENIAANIEREVLQNRDGAR
jgi:Fe-S-cluster containining protein